MIDNYNEVMEQWAGGTSVGCCTNMVEIKPDCEVDNLLEQITASGVTKEEVEQMISDAIASKADKAQVDALAEQVAQNTERILNTYTKQETNQLLQTYLTKLEANEMFANYSKVEDTTLILNNENITI